MPIDHKRLNEQINERFFKALDAANTDSMTLRDIERRLGLKTNVLSDGRANKNRLLVFRLTKVSELFPSLDINQIMFGEDQPADKVVMALQETIAQQKKEKDALIRLVEKQKKGLRELQELAAVLLKDGAAVIEKHKKKYLEIAG